MNYPPAPWQLRGDAIQTLSLVDIDLVRQFVPPELDIVAILPGKTIGSIYISEYQLGSVLTYNESIVAPALVRDRPKIGGLISHIYVDGNLLYFDNNFQGQISSIDSTLVISESSPFASLNLSDPFLTIDLQDLKLVAGSPEFIKIV